MLHVSAEPMMRRHWYLIALAVLAGGTIACSGCRDHGSTSDLGPPAPDVRRDSRLPDAGPDQGPDSRAGDAGCGGSRTVAPQAVKRGTGLPCGKGCKQVTFGDYPDHYDVKNDLIVYEGGASLYGDLYYVDLTADEEWLVRKMPATQKAGCRAVATDGKRLAYSCPIRPEPVVSWIQTLTLYDPAKRTETDLMCIELFTALHACDPSSMGLGDTGVAVNMSTTSCKTPDTYFYRFSDGSFTNISKNYGQVWETQMSESLIVWTGVGAKDTNIVLYDTTTNTQKLVDPSDRGQFHPRIEGNRIVWVDHRNSTGDMWDQGASDIYLHDLSTGKTESVIIHSARQDYPDVWGDWVVWEDWRNNPNPTPRYASEFINSDIFAKNLKTGQVAQLTSGKGMELRPQVDNDRVFFTMLDGNQSASLFMIDLKQRLP